MSISSVIVGLAFVLSAGAILLEPHVRRRNARMNVRSRGERLGLRKDGVLKVLRDLDFDFEMGKLQECDYKVSRAELVREAAEVFNALDRQEEEIDGQLEAAVRNLRISRPNISRCPACSLQLKVGDRYCPVCGTAVGETCSNCGENLERGDRYCSACEEPSRPLD